MKDGMPRNGWRKKREKYQTRALHELPYTEIVISSTDSPHGWHALSLIMMPWWCVPRIHRTVLCGVHHRGQWRKSVPWGCIIQYTWLSYVVSTKGQWRKSAYHEGVYYSVVHTRTWLSCVGSTRGQWRKADDSTCIVTSQLACFSIVITYLRE